MIGALVVFLGFTVEFVIHRYTSNRSVVFRTEGTNVQICREKEWQEFSMKEAAVNPGSPGMNGETEMTKGQYADKLKQLVATDVNVIRTGVVLPPAFYQAFFEYNLLTDKPLYLLQGIHLDEDYGKINRNAYENKYNADFREAIRRTIDVVHGKAPARQSNGYASASYKLNISPYVMGFVLCEDIDTNFVITTNEKNSHVKGFEGDYLYTVNASPYEAWLAAMGNFAISYEQEKYGGPCKFMCWTNWSGPEQIRITEKYNAGILAFHHLRDKPTP